MVLNEVNNSSPGGFVLRSLAATRLDRCEDSGARFSDARFPDSLGE
jgi:hypothetical protein